MKLLTCPLITAAVVLAAISIMDLESNAQNAGKFADVNGLKMYYEVRGSGEPLVLIHGGGSTIETSFGRVMPLLAKTRKVIAVERQAHGRTADRETAATFEQDADDIAELLKQIGVRQADFLGFSNGGHTAIEIALRHPALVRKLVIASANTNREGMPPEFWKGMENPRFTDMPQIYKDAFLKVNNDPDALTRMFERDSSRMKLFKGWTDEQIRSIRQPTLVVCGDKNDIIVEHAVRTYRLLPNAQLLIMPGGHGAYMEEAMYAGSKQAPAFVDLLNEFLTH